MRIIGKSGLLALLVVMGCGKYEDGPNFTLSRRSVRLENIWKAEKVTYSTPDTTIDRTADFANFQWEYTGNGNFQVFADFVGRTEVYRGTWRFAENDEHVTVLAFPVIPDSCSLPYYVEDNEILRLTHEEYHYRQTIGVDSTIRFEMVSGI